MTTLSPMMLQWQDCKKQAGSALLLFRLGDFYEAFEEDALLLSKELEVTLTKRQEIPMAGVPFHASEGYIDKLLAKGYRVAIAEQMENPASCKGIVKREVVRILSPGTLIQSSLLNEKSHNFIASAAFVGKIFSLTFLDVTTASFITMELESIHLLNDELYRRAPKEILISEKWAAKHPDIVQEWVKEFSPLIHKKEESFFSQEYTLRTLLRHFQIERLEALGLAEKSSCICSAGALLSYVRDDLRLNVEHIRSLITESGDEHMQIDRSTQRHLEIFDPPLHKKGGLSLLSILDDTKTSMGGRLLKQWLSHPLLNCDRIKERQKGIQELIANPLVLLSLQQSLSGIQDLTRLMMRIETKCASPRDLSGLRLSCEQIDPLKKSLSCFLSSIFQEIAQDLTDLSAPLHILQNSLVDSPPLRVTDGGLFQEGYHPELTTLQALQKDSESWVVNYQIQLREQTGIKTLKVGYTNAFGYYIEISRGQAENAPSSFERKQTLMNAERFITKELKEFEYKILHAEERIAALEQQLFGELREKIASFAAPIHTVAKAVGKLDCLVSLATVAKKRNYTCPTVDDSDSLAIEQGRHPIIETVLEDPYIPNDLFFDEDNGRLHLITGPNMAGKSTFIRQTALIVIMAQIGSFVPAKQALIGIIDRLFTRIGANDDLSKGQSTFMVEMTETAHILQNATSQSLVILDEIGRGTSTYDGIAIAWAVAEYLLTQQGKLAKTLFATHYWELTALESLFPRAKNYRVAVHETLDGIVFLHKIERGSADKSYGIHVAKLAGLPSTVLASAKERLRALEQGQRKTSSQATQLSLLPLPSTHPIIEQLKALNPNTVSPIDALKTLFAWKQEV